MMPQAMSKLSMVGDPIGTIILRNSEVDVEGNILFSNEYDALPDFYKLELLNDIMSVCRNEYEEVNAVMEEDAEIMRQDQREFEKELEQAVKLRDQTEH